MTQRKHFHVLYALRYVRYGLLLCLVPMLQALLRFDLNRFYTALRQDAAILAACLALALALWQAAGFWLTDSTLEVSQGVFFKTQFSVSHRSIAVLEISRPLYCRLLGASCVTLYFKNFSTARKVSFFVSKGDANRLADALLPVRRDHSVFAPAGFERISLVMLSANLLTTIAFAVLGLRHLEKIFGEGVRNLAYAQIAHLEVLVERWLPAGLALLATLVFLLISLTFLYAFFRTAGFSVCRNGGIIISRGGLITKTERRIVVSCVSSCDVRVTLAARLLRRRPVYVRAGSFDGGDIPLLVYKKGEDTMPEILLPHFTTPHQRLCEPARKSPVGYLWRPGTCFVLSATLMGVASWTMPAILPVLCVPLVLSLLSLLVSLEGLLYEGICSNENRTVSLCFTRLFTRHEVCVFTPDIAYTLFEHPFAVSGGWCDVYVHLPCRARYRVRGVLQYVARSLPFTL